MSYLDLGFCQGYMALQYHLEEAIEESNGKSTANITSSPPYAIFSHKYYNQIKEIKNIKSHDYCWIGSIESCWTGHRLWILDFAKKYFTDKSIFINTDFPSDWVLLGSYDLTHLKCGFNPKLATYNQSKEAQYRKVEENLFYFQSMRQSIYCLCPRGDSSWSFRFYEVLMCESIPIVNSYHDTYRTVEEAGIDYRYLLIENIKDDFCIEAYLKHNTEIFKKYHLLN